MANAWHFLTKNTIPQFLQFVLLKANIKQYVYVPGTVSAKEKHNQVAKNSKLVSPKD